MPDLCIPKKTSIIERDWHAHAQIVRSAIYQLACIDFASSCAARHLTDWQASDTFQRLIHLTTLPRSGGCIPIRNPNHESALINQSSKRSSSSSGHGSCCNFLEMDMSHESWASCAWCISMETNVELMLTWITHDQDMSNKSGSSRPRPSLRVRTPSQPIPCRSALRHYSEGVIRRGFQLELEPTRGKCQLTPCPVWPI